MTIIWFLIACVGMFLTYLSPMICPRGWREPGVLRAWLVGALGFVMLLAGMALSIMTGR